MLLKAFCLYLVLWMAHINGLALKDEKSLNPPSKNYVDSNLLTTCFGTKSTYNSSGTLTSPDYPSYSTGGRSCSFTIYARPGANIQININEFYIRDSYLYSNFQISNSTSVVAKLTSSYYGRTYNLGSYANIYFYLYNSNSYGRFSLTWRQTRVSQCQGPDILFLLDRSQAIYSDYYNGNVKTFVNQLSMQYSFLNDVTPENPFSSRFGVIEFSDDATVTIPLKQYTSDEFLNELQNNVSYGDGGESNVAAALSLAYDEIIAHGSSKYIDYKVPRIVVLVVNDISRFGYDQTLAAMNKLKEVVQIPIGVIIPGIPGILPDAQGRLANLIGNENNTFASPDNAVFGVPALSDSSFTCPLCSNLVFICEMTVAIGNLDKLKCLQLAQRLASVTADNDKKRYAIATYGKEIYQGIELQTFGNFNKTINNMIDTVNTTNYPNGGQTYLAPILNQLYTFLNSTFTTSKAATFTLIMGELTAIRDPSLANIAAQTVASLKSSIYVLDASRLGTVSNLWSTLTNSQSNHVFNGTIATDSIFNSLNATLLQEYNTARCS